MTLACFSLLASVNSTYKSSKYAADTHLTSKNLKRKNTVDRTCQKAIGETGGGQRILCLKVNIIQRILRKKKWIFISLQT